MKIKITAPNWRNALKAILPYGKIAGWVLSGAALATVISVGAQQAGTTSNKQCGLNDAAMNAVNNKIKQIGYTSPDPSKYFTVGGVQSCLGPIANANMDLSRLIPDLLNLLSSAVSSAIDGLTKQAIDKACTSARASMGDTITRYNDSVYATVGTQGSGRGLIDNTIGKQVETKLNEYGVAYNKNSTTAVDVLKGVTPNTTVPTGTTGTGTSTTGTVNLLPKNAQNASEVTTAAGQLEAARLNLERVKNSGSWFTNNDARVQQAQATYDNALRNYNQAAQRVGTTPATPVAPATIGTSMYDKK